MGGRLTISQVVSSKFAPQFRFPPALLIFIRGSKELHPETFRGSFGVSFKVGFEVVPPAS